MAAQTLNNFNSLDSDALSTVGGGRGICRYVWSGANGYSCRYPDGRWDYIVTKSPSQAVYDIAVHGWSGFYIAP